jgi:hypothetical protein
MKRAVLVVLVFCFAALQAQAQTAIRWKGSAGWGQATPYERLFNQFNLQTLNGTIYSIDTVTPMSGMSMGIQLTVKLSGGEKQQVHLGPAWYVLCQDMNLGLNDAVEVRGARFTLNGKNVIAAFEVRTPEKVLLLRDQDNVPYWCGWRKRKI